MSSPRFFIDHGMIHDRVTGKHVTTEEDGPFCDGINACCSLLNELSNPIRSHDSPCPSCGRPWNGKIWTDPCSQGGCPLGGDF